MVCHRILLLIMRMLKVTRANSQVLCNFAMVIGHVTVLNRTIHTLPQRSHLTPICLVNNAKIIHNVSDRTFMTFHVILLWHFNICYGRVTSFTSFLAALSLSVFLFFINRISNIYFSLRIEFDCERVFYDLKM